MICETQQYGASSSCYKTTKSSLSLINGSGQMDDRRKNQRFYNGVSGLKHYIIVSVMNTRKKRNFY